MKKVLLLIFLFMLFARCNRSLTSSVVSEQSLLKLNRDEINSLIQIRESLHYYRVLPFKDSAIQLVNNKVVRCMPPDFRKAVLPYFNTISEKLTPDNPVFANLLSSLKLIPTIGEKKIISDLVTSGQVADAFADPILSYMQQGSIIDTELMKSRGVYDEMIPCFKELVKLEPQQITKELVYKKFRQVDSTKNAIAILTGVFNGNTRTNDLQNLLAGSEENAIKINKDVQDYQEMLAYTTTDNKTGPITYEDILGDFKRKIQSYDLWPALLGDFNVVVANIQKAEKTYSAGKTFKAGTYNVFNDLLAQKIYFDTPVSETNANDYLDIKTNNPNLFVRVRFKNNTFERIAIQKSIADIPVQLSFVETNHSGWFNLGAFQKKIHPKGIFKNTRYSNLLTVKELPLGVTVNGLTLSRSGSGEKNIVGDSLLKLNFTPNSSEYRYIYDQAKLKKAEEDLGIANASLSYHLKEVSFLADANMSTRLLIDWRPSQLISKINPDKNIQNISVNLNNWHGINPSQVHNQIQRLLTSHVDSLIRKTLSLPAANSTINQYFHAEHVSVSKVTVDTLVGVRMEFAYQKATVGNQNIQVDSGNITFTQNASADNEDQSKYIYSVNSFDYNAYEKRILANEVIPYIKNSDLAKLSEAQVQKKAEIVASYVSLNTPQVDLENNEISAINPQITGAMINEIEAANKNDINHLLEAPVNTACSVLESGTINFYGLQLSPVSGTCKDGAFEARLPGHGSIRLLIKDRSTFDLEGEVDNNKLINYYVDSLKSLFQFDESIKIDNPHFEGRKIVLPIKLFAPGLFINKSIVEIVIDPEKGRLSRDFSVALTKAALEDFLKTQVSTILKNSTDAFVKYIKDQNYLGTDLPIDVSYAGDFNWEQRNFTIKLSRTVTLLDAYTINIQASVNISFKNGLQAHFNPPDNDDLKEQFLRNGIQQLAKSLPLGNQLSIDIHFTPKFSIDAKINLDVGIVGLIAEFKFTEGERLHLVDAGVTLGFIPVIGYAGFYHPAVHILPEEQEIQVESLITFGTEEYSAKTFSTIVNIQSTAHIHYGSNIGVIDFEGQLNILMFPPISNTKGQINIPKMSMYCKSNTDIDLKVLKFSMNNDVSFQKIANGVQLSLSDNIGVNVFNTNILNGECKITISAGSTTAINANAGAGAFFVLGFFHAAGNVDITLPSTIGMSLSGSFGLNILPNMGFLGKLLSGSCDYNLGLSDNQILFSTTIVGIGISGGIPVDTKPQDVPGLLAKMILERLPDLPKEIVSCMFSFFTTGKLCKVEISLMPRDQSQNKDKQKPPPPPAGDPNPPKPLTPAGEKPAAPQNPPATPKVNPPVQGGLKPNSGGTSHNGPQKPKEDGNDSKQGGPVDKTIPPKTGGDTTKNNKFTSTEGTVNGDQNGSTNHQGNNVDNNLNGDTTNTTIDTGSSKTPANSTDHKQLHGEKKHKTTTTADASGQETTKEQNLNGVDTSVHSSKPKKKGKRIIVLPKDDVAQIKDKASKDDDEVAANPFDKKTISQDDNEVKIDPEYRSFELSKIYPGTALAYPQIPSVPYLIYQINNAKYCCFERSDISKYRGYKSLSIQIGSHWQLNSIRLPEIGILRYIDITRNYIDHKALDSLEKTRIDSLKKELEIAHLRNLMTQSQTKTNKSTSNTTIQIITAPVTSESIIAIEEGDDNDQTPTPPKTHQKVIANDQNNDNVTHDQTPPPNPKDTEKALQQARLDLEKIKHKMESLRLKISPFAVRDSSIERKKQQVIKDISAITGDHQTGKYLTTGLDIGIMNFRHADLTETSHHKNVSTSMIDGNILAIYNADVTVKFGNQSYQLQLVDSIHDESGKGQIYHCIIPYETDDIQATNKYYSDLATAFNGNPITRLRTLQNNHKVLKEVFNKKFNDVKLIIFRRDDQFVLSTLIESPLLTKNDLFVGPATELNPIPLVHANGMQSSLDEIMDLISREISFKVSDLNFVLNAEDKNVTVATISSRIKSSNNLSAAFFEFIDRHVENDQSLINSPIKLRNALAEKNIYFFIGRDDDKFALKIFKDKDTTALAKVDLVEYFKSKCHLKSTEEFQTNPQFQSFCYKEALEQDMAKDYYLFNTENIKRGPLFLKMDNTGGYGQLSRLGENPENFSPIPAKIYFASSKVQDEALGQNMAFYNFSDNIKKHSDFLNRIAALSVDGGISMFYIDDYQNQLIAFAYDPNGGCSMVFEDKAIADKLVKSSVFKANLDNAAQGAIIAGRSNPYKRLNSYTLDHDFKTFSLALLTGWKGQERDKKDIINPLILFSKHGIQKTFK